MMGEEFDGLNKGGGASWSEFEFGRRLGLQASGVIAGVWASRR